MSAARTTPEKHVVLYQDEGTFTRQPTPAPLYAPRGRRQPRMHWATQTNEDVRVIAYLNAVSGAVHSEQVPSVTAARLAANVAGIAQWYPTAETITVVWDNWPVHAHEKVLEALGEQPRIRVLPLPTYAPWLNPADKLVRWIRQKITHAHRWADDFTEFCRQIDAGLAISTDGSPDLLRYVGLQT